MRPRRTTRAYDRRAANRARRSSSLAPAWSFKLWTRPRPSATSVSHFAVTSTVIGTHEAQRRVGSESVGDRRREGADHQRVSVELERPGDRRAVQDFGESGAHANGKPVTPPRTAAVPRVCD